MSNWKIAFGFLGLMIAIANLGFAMYGPLAWFRPVNLAIGIDGLRAAFEYFKGSDDD